jgi:hypothetical protein
MFEDCDDLNDFENFLNFYLIKYDSDFDFIADSNDNRHYIYYVEINLNNLNKRQQKLLKPYNYFPI